MPNKILDFKVQTCNIFATSGTNTDKKNFIVNVKDDMKISAAILPTVDFEFFIKLLSIPNVNDNTTWIVYLLDNALTSTTSFILAEFFKTSCKSSQHFKINGNIAFNFPVVKTGDNFNRRYFHLAPSNVNKLPKTYETFKF